MQDIGTLSEKDYHNQCKTLLASGNINEALTTSATGLQHYPQSLALWLLTGSIHFSRRAALPALECIERATTLGGHLPTVWKFAADGLARLRPERYPEWYTSLLARCLQQPTVSPLILVNAVTAFVTSHPCYKEVLAWSHTSAPCSPIPHAALAWISNPALMVHLQLERPCHPQLEPILTAIRSGLLTAVSSNHPDTAHMQKVALVIAQHCHVVEFVYAESEMETRLVDQLKSSLETSIINTRSVDMGSLAVFAAYRPLRTLSQACLDILDQIQEPHLQHMLKLQVHDRKREAELQSHIPSLTPIQNDVSTQVRAQYEENPYPRWVRPGEVDRPASINAYLQWLFPSTPLPALPDAFRMLIAGCGTGRSAINYACMFPQASVLAIDLSRASLAYGRKKAEEMGVANLRFAQADIAELGTFAERFHVINCDGVIHHMQSPQLGWRVLRDLLHPRGFLNLALYSERSRTPVVAARDFIARGGYDSSPESIRRCRQDLRALPTDHPAHAITEWRDFYTMSMCRDLIFHVQEHRFTLAEIGQITSDLGMDFVGMQSYDRTRMRALYASRFPEEPLMNSADNWDEIDRQHPDLFHSMYQFWVMKR